jgi:ATP-dependent DNA helicase RecQ
LEAYRPPESSTHPEKLLREIFGFESFLPYQRQIIDAVLEGKDLLAVLPTGSGKSLCFQIPALLRKGLTIVISPLIALMKDQIDRLRKYALPVEFINSSLSPAEMKNILDSVRAGLVRIVYISPERLRDPLFLHAIRLRHAEPPLWVVDEAHCITEWGHDFRTDYLFIPDAIDLVAQKSQLILFTATATPLVREDILRQMKRPSAVTICGTFDRPNLYLGCRAARTRHEKLQTLRPLMRKPGPGIIYAATRKQCETVCRFLQENRLRADFYHAGRSGHIREEVHEKFMADELDVVVATNAFGMGLNKPDIRFIIHYAHPGSIDAYYQEIGRGGRDGGRCDCILLFSSYDRKVQEQFIRNSTPSPDSILNFFREITRNLKENRLLINRRLYEHTNIELFELEKAGVLEREHVPCGTGSIYLSRQFDRMCALLSPMEKEIVNALESQFALSKTGLVNALNLHEFCPNFMPELSPFSVEQTLLGMAERGLIVYRPENQDISYRVQTQGLLDEAVREIERSVKTRRNFKLRRLEVMVRYGACEGCLRKYLLASLEDHLGADGCGFCDNC